MEEPSTTSIAKDDLIMKDSGKVDPTKACSDSIGRFHHRCARFNILHYIWVQDTGFLLHPTILTAYRESEHLRVAQIGIGTGIGMVYAWREIYSRSSIDGYDVDTSHAIPEEWRYSHCKIHYQDLGRPLIHDWQIGRYNIVHLRFAASLVRDDNPDFLLANAVAMLVPGGWIQLDEFDLASASVVTTNKQPTDLFPNAETLARLTREKGAKTHRWLSHLPHLLIKQCLDDVEEFRRPLSMEYVTASTDMLVLAWEEEMLSLRKDGDEEERVRRAVLEGALRGFEEESLRAGRGVAIRMDRVIGLARKGEGWEGKMKAWEKDKNGWVHDDDEVSAFKVVGGEKT